MEAFDAYNELNKAGIKPGHSEAILKVIKRSMLDIEEENRSVKEKIAEVKASYITKEDIESLATDADLESKIK